MKLKELLAYSGGTLLNEVDDTMEIEAFTIDSREQKENSFFIPLSSKIEERPNHIRNAFENGAIGAFSTEEIAVPQGKFLIKVDNTLEALHTLAKNDRMSMMNVPLIAITGSVGKTTTKDMVYAVLSSTYTTLKNEGNFNNEIGMPFTLINYQNQEMIILEMGMSAMGEMSLLTNIAKPNVALITNIGTSHIGNLGSRENILKAKLEILEGMDEEGTLILNTDNDLLGTVEKVKPRLMTVGIQKQADYQAYNVQVNKDCTTFCVQESGKEYAFKIMLSSEKFVYNALLAIGVGRLYHIPMEKIQAALEHCQYTKMRMNIEKINGMTIINDCYNASLESIKAALDALLSQNGKRKVAILGDVLELGKYSSKLHEEIGKAVAEAKVDKLISIGDFCQDVKNGAVQNGMPETAILTLSKTEDVLDKLDTILEKEDDVLVKASRGMKFETIIEKIDQVLTV